MKRKIWKIRGWKLPAVSLMGVAFALISVLSRPATQVHKPLETPPRNTFKNTVSGIGVVEPKSQLISIGVDIPGIVRDVPVKVGDYIKSGDLLFMLDQRYIDAKIFTLEKTLLTFEIQAEDAAAQFTIVKDIEDKRAVAKDDFNRRKYRRQFSLAKIEEIKAQLNEAKTTKERLSIKSPIDGRVLEINVRTGEYASVGTLSLPLIRIGDVSTLHVRVEIDEENASRVTPENKAYGVKRGDTQNQHPLTFVRFEPYVRPKQNLAVSSQRIDTRVLQVIYALPENTSSIFVGQQMDVFLEERSPRT